MKNNKKYTFIIIAAVIAITFVVLRQSADAPTDTSAQDISPEEIVQTQNSYIGLSIEDASELAESKGEAFRVVNIDEEPQPATMDYRPGQINASTVDGVVTEFSVEGE